jgi:hypothetical protein
MSVTRMVYEGWKAGKLLEFEAEDAFKALPWSVRQGIASSLGLLDDTETSTVSNVDAIFERARVLWVMGKLTRAISEAVKELEQKGAKPCHC